MTSLLLEAERCLLCKKPRCKSNCHINTPIPKIMKLYKENKLTESRSILFENNPLSIICSVVYPHDKQCKENCVSCCRNKNTYANFSIRRIKVCLLKKKLY